MSAHAWVARKNGAHSKQARADRADNLQCRFPGCILKRNGAGARRHHVHFVPDVTIVPLDSWMLGSNRKGRRRARKQTAVRRRWQQAGR